MNANRHTVKLLRTLFVTVWLLSGCSVAWAQEKVTLRLDFIPNGYHGPFYMALDKGYYREDGLEVQIGRGFGWMDDARMKNTMEQATRDFKLERKVTAGDFYTNEFVPVPPVR